MKNKYNILLKVPSLYKTYDILIPINKTIGETILVLIKALKEITNNSFDPENNIHLYDSNTGEKYNIEEFVYKTNIKNGSILILC